MAVDGKTEEVHDLKSILSGEGRDFLVKSNGDQVKITDISNKVVGVYFGASTFTPCHHFTPKLVEIYKELASTGNDFEVIFVSDDENENSFHGFFSDMPWLAIPFSDSGTRNRLKEIFSVKRKMDLVILEGSGKVISQDGILLVMMHGSEGYPFTTQKIMKLKEDEEAAKKEQTLRSILTHPSRDFLISSNGDKVPVSDLEGKVVGIYISESGSKQCGEFTSVLAEMYKKLKERGENFEVVLVSLDEEKASYDVDLARMPWLAIPFNDKSCSRIYQYFEMEGVPMLVIIGSDGKTVHKNVADLVEEYGIEAYPFTPDNLVNLEDKQKAKFEALTLESLLVSPEQNYVIGKGNDKVPVSDLVGKNILFYFSAHWCPPCRSFTPKLIETYHKIKERDNAFDVVFVSWDNKQNSFDEYYGSMPWLALPFGDERCKFLNRTFKIRGIPSLVAIGPAGISNNNVRDLVMLLGADAYPFTEERVRQLEAETEEMAKGWPKTIRHNLHKEHELVLTKQGPYECDGCKEGAMGYVYSCRGCAIDLHPKCALGEDEKKKMAASKDLGEKETTSQEGYVCDGDVCRKV